MTYAPHRAKWTHYRVLAASFGLVAITATGCGGSSDVGATGVELPQLPGIDPGNSYAVVTAVLDAENGNVQAREEANQLAVEECMTERGHDFQLQASRILAATPYEFNHVWLHDEGQDAGFGMVRAVRSTDNPGTILSEANAAIVAELSESEAVAYLADYNGEGAADQERWEESCIYRVFVLGEEDDVYSPMMLDEGLRAAIADGLAGFYGSAAFENAMEDWSRCMEGQGHSYSDRGAMFEELRTFYTSNAKDLSAVEAEELRLAAADDQCAPSLEDSLLATADDSLSTAARQLREAGIAD